MTLKKKKMFPLSSSKDDNYLNDQSTFFLHIFSCILSSLSQKEEQNFLSYLKIDR